MTLYKYPRTPHFPWSPGKTRDDRVMHNVEKCFNGRMVVASIKMDGENITMYPDHIHARSIDSKDHESRHWVKALHSRIAHNIQEGYRICGENLYAKHSIHYKDLDSYFYLYSVWNDKNMCLSFDDTAEICMRLSLEHVPILYIGRWAPHIQDKLKGMLSDRDEGYVVRLFSEFHYDNFETSVAKYVRKGHVQADQHWMHRKLVKNLLR